MDGARLSRFPHLSWLAFPVAGHATGTISLTLTGNHDARRITHGREISSREDTGVVNVLPADGERHTFVTAMSPDLETDVFLIPPGHLRAALEAEGCPPSTQIRHRVTHDDPLLRSCMARLAAGTSHGAGNSPRRADEAARRLLLRLVELDGGAMPDWQGDTSVFHEHTIRHLVEYIDEHLRIAATLTSMGLLVGLSPSHFVEKFRPSTGLSLRCFINRRRVNRSLEVCEPAKRHAALLGDLVEYLAKHSRQLMNPWSRTPKAAGPCP